MKPKRLNLSPWIASRVRRLKAKLASGRHWTAAGYVDVPREEMERCRGRLKQLTG